MTHDIHHDKILILDFGSQYTQLIARRVREIGVYCELHPFDLSAADIKRFNPRGIILSGGPESVNAAPRFRASQSIFTLGIPILGICYGMQIMAAQLGGTVAVGEQGEFGLTQVQQAQPSSKLLAGVPKAFAVWMSHGDKITQLPADFSVSAYSGNKTIAAIENIEKNYYAVQFHPEVTHTAQGMRILTNFVRDICACEALWTAGHIIEDHIVQIKKQIAQDHVILGLSGGVDSSVVAALLHRAIGDQLTCVFVDTGLLRLQEGEQVMKILVKHMQVKVICVDAKTKFMQALQGITDPEEKRKIIGRLFIEVFDAEAKKIGDAKWLAQGTIYPDVIESADAKTGKAHAIKSHHNVGGLPQKMHLRLIEPLRELFKDEVRKIGIALGLPHSMVYRHPFPGPGLGVRILGEVKVQYADILRQADHIFIEELRAHDWYDKTAQAFAVFLPIKSVGVMGDQRKYDYVIALRAVETVDFMTARWARLPYELIDRVAHRIVNEVRGISRVVYDVSGKPPATIEWE